MKRNSGFTLIELVIVIIVLGILAATAVPKFINLQDDAKESAMKGVESALHSAANIVYSKAAIEGVESTPTSSVSDAGTTITTAYGYPDATTTGIEESIELSGFSATDATASGGLATMVFWNGNASATTDTCVFYTQASDTERYIVADGDCPAQ